VAFSHNSDHPIISAVADSGRVAAHSEISTLVAGKFANDNRRYFDSALLRST